MTRIFKIHSLLCFFSIFFFACGDSQKQEDEEAAMSQTKEGPKVEQPVSVHIVKLNETIFNRELLANGKLEAVKRANLKFLTEGVIKRIFIKESDRVGVGQRLAILDNTQQERIYSQNKLKYKQALLDYEDQLLRLGYRMADTAKVAKEFKSIARLRSGLSNTEIELQRAGTDLSYTSLTAPFSGKIANLKAKEYNSSSAFEYFCTLIDDTELLVDFLVLEQELPFIRSSKSLSIKPFNDESLSYTGTIVSINPLVDKSGMIGVKALVKNKDRKLLDGMSVKVTVQQSIPKQLTIPKNALLERQGRKVVFTAKGRMAYWNYVEVAYENSAEYAIKSGLKPGDQVIYEGNFNLAHDKPITIAN